MSKELNYWLIDGNYQYNNATLTPNILSDVISGNVALSSVTSESGVGLANPATEMANKIIAFFKDQPDATVSYAYAPEKDTVADFIKNCNIYRGDDTHNPSIVSIYVSDSTVADYLNRTIKHQYNFGGILLDVIIIDASLASLTAMDKPSFGISENVSSQLKKALKGNPNIVDFFSIYVQIFDTYYHFVETSARPIVVQIDNFSNFRGFDTILPIDLFKEIFDSNTYEGNPTLAGLLISTHVSDFKK